MRRVTYCGCVIAIMAFAGVADGQGLVANAGADQSVEQASYAGTEVTLDGSGSSGEPGGGGDTRVLDFEDLDPGHSGTGPVPAGYGEMTWSSTAYWVTKDYSPDSGYGLTVTGRVGIYSAYIKPLVISGVPFHFVSAKVGTAWLASDTAVFEGYRDDELIYTRTIQTNNTGGGGFTFDFRCIDTLVVVPGGSQTVLDDLTFADPNVGGGGVVAWDWYEGDTLLGSGESLSVPLNLGEHHITLVVSDDAGNTATDACVVTVSDTTPPALGVEGAPSYEQNALDGAFVSHYDVEVSVSDACDTAVDVTYDPPEGATLPLGESVVTVTAVDDSGNVSTATFGASVVDTTPPDMIAPPDITVEQKSLDGTVVDLVGPEVADICDANPEIASNAPDVFALGATSVVWTAADDSGNVATCRQLVTVVDTKAPRIARLMASPCLLWPPNGKMVEVTVSAQVSDACDAEPSCRIVRVLCSEHPGRRGHDRHRACNDWEITGPLTVDLRAECRGHAKARIYFIEVEAVDASGNTSRALTAVLVIKPPHCPKPRR